MKWCCDKGSHLINRTIGVINQLKCRDNADPPGAPLCPSPGFMWGVQMGASPRQNVSLHPNGDLQHVLYDTASRRFTPEAYCLDTQSSTPTYAVVCIADNSEEHIDVLHTFYPAGLFVSIICFTMAIILQALFVKRWNLQNRLLLYNLSCWLLGYSSLLLRYFMDHILHCLITGVLIHYSFLAAFCWLNVLAVHMCVKLSARPISKEKQINVYNLLGWGLPAMFTATAVAVYLQDSKTNTHSPDAVTCYMSIWVELVCFYGPFAFGVCINLLLFVTITLRIRILHKKQQKLQEKSKMRLQLCVRLFIILGIGWVVEAISWLREMPSEVQYAAVIVNLLQGPLVLLVTFYDVIKWRRVNCSPSYVSCCFWTQEWKPQESCTTTSLTVL